MEAAAVSSSLSLISNSRWPPHHHPSSTSPCRSPIIYAAPSIRPLCLTSRHAKRLVQFKAGKERSWSGLRSSATESPSTGSSEKWLLEPVGDGDSRHIGYKVPLPNAFEISSDVVTVGRLPEKADMVIPVATVSGLHARLEKKGGALLVTDLDSTNGTFIDDKKLSPRAAAIVSPGSCVAFGDIHLAIFRVSKVEEPVASGETAESEIKAEADASVKKSEVSK